VVVIININIFYFKNGILKVLRLYLRYNILTKSDASNYTLLQYAKRTQLDLVNGRC